MLSGRSRKLSSAEELSAALEVIQEVAKSEAGQPFAEAVSDFDAPDYSRWVRKPMDLGLVASKLGGNQYVSTGDFAGFGFSVSFQEQDEACFCCATMFAWMLHAVNAVLKTCHGLLCTTADALLGCRESICEGMSGLEGQDIRHFRHPHNNILLNQPEVLSLQMGFCKMWSLCGATAVCTTPMKALRFWSCLTEQRTCSVLCGRKQACRRRLEFQQAEIK